MKSARVLVIEDDPDIRTAISEALACAGYEAIEAGDGLEGLGAARRSAPDLILLDLMMPRMDGRSFRAAQLADPQLAHIPVAIVSAALPQEVHDVDAVAHLHKPFGLDDLFDLVARFTRRRPDVAADGHLATTA
jgi:CheY-like chemotaxis protein